MSDALEEAQGEAAPWDELVAGNIRAELARQRWTGRKAAAALSLTPTYVARRLRGDTVLSPGDLKMFADFLEVPVATFFELPEYRDLQIPATWEPKGPTKD